MSVVLRGGQGQYMPGLQGCLASQRLGISFGSQRLGPIAMGEEWETFQEEKMLGAEA